MVCKFLKIGKCQRKFYKKLVWIQRHSSPPALAGAVPESFHTVTAPHCTQTFLKMNYFDATPPMLPNREGKGCVPVRYAADNIGSGNGGEFFHVLSRCSAFIRSNPDRVLKKTGNRCIWLYACPVWAAAPTPSFRGGLAAVTKKYLEIHERYISPRCALLVHKSFQHCPLPLALAAVPVCKCCNALQTFVNING